MALSAEQAHAWPDATASAAIIAAEAAAVVQAAEALTE